MQLSGAEITIKLLEQQGVDTIAGIPGGANLPLYHALGKSSIKHILARHEQGAGFIAQGMARTNGKPAVCFGTSGPGATNLLTAIADAYLDSVPVIAITGQVPTGMLGSDAFQEVDTYGMSIPITKHNFLARSAASLLDIIPEAFEIAMSGRPGPILIDIPKDVQKEMLELDSFPEIFPGKSSELSESWNPHSIEQAALAINIAEKPVLYIGGGINISGAEAELIALAEKNSIPIATSFMGLGAVPSTHPLYLGMVGMHGAEYTNYTLQESDLLIALGARFGDRTTGKVKEFCPHAKILHVDIDSSELNKIKSTDWSFEGDVKSFLKAIWPLIEPNDRSQWSEQVQNLKKNYPLPLPDQTEAMHPVNIIQRAGIAAGPDALIATDVGQHQMWTAQFYPFVKARSFFSSGGLGTMGFGLPTAIGAAVAEPDKPVLCFTGDGSFLMNIQELDTLAELGSNVKIILLNNNALGLVRQQQELFFEKQYTASQFATQPDFCNIARSFGIPAYDLADSSDPMFTLEEAIKADGPALIHIPIDQELNVFPMVAPGAANQEMITGA